MIARSHIWRHAERTTLRRSWLELGAALAAVETNMTEDGRMVRAPPAAGVDPESTRDRRVCPNGQRHAQAAADPGLSSMFQVRHKIAWPGTHVSWTASGGTSLRFSSYDGLVVLALRLRVVPLLVGP